MDDGYESDEETDYPAMMSTIANGCPRLERLSLYGIEEMRKSVISQLHVHSGIRYLAIESELSLPRRDLMAILNIPNLKHLVLDSILDKDMKKLVESKIPVVEYRSSFGRYRVC